MLRQFIEEKREWIRKNEGHISSFSLVAGFVIDNLTLKRIDLLFENLVLFFYLAVSAVCIAVYNLHKGGSLQFGFLDKYSFLLPLALQFAFGGLFSGFIVFYSRSASLMTSWPFLFVLVSILLSGEFIRGFYKRLDYQLTVFFAAAFSFLIFYIPIVFHTMNSVTFVASGFAALVVFFLFYRLLLKMIPAIVSPDKQRIWYKVFTVFFVVNLFYFTNILPPIPLSLKEGGIYYSVTRSPDGYALTQEKRNFVEELISRNVIKISPGQPVYAFSSVFAPTDLNIPVIHEWQFRDEEKNEWVTMNTIKFPIVGGSDGGYRGYSFKENIFPGKWRVSVKTPSGQVIGRLPFTVQSGSLRNVKETIYR